MRAFVQQISKVGYRCKHDVIWEEQFNFPNGQGLIKPTPRNSLVKINQQVWKYYSEFFLLVWRQIQQWILAAFFFPSYPAMLFQWSLVEVHKRFIMFIDGKWIPAARSRNFDFHCWSAKVQGTVCELECVFWRKSTPEKHLNVPLFGICCHNKYKKAFNP